MIYRGSLSCANPRCRERLPFAIRTPGEADEHSCGEWQADADASLSLSAYAVGWKFEIITTYTGDGDELEVCGWLCPHCALGAGA